MAKDKQEQAATPLVAPAYSKEQFMTSTRFSSTEKDVLSVLLRDDTEHTVEQAEALIDDYLRREVQ